MVSSCFPKWCTPERVNVLSLVIHSVFSPDNVDREEDNFLRVYKNLYGFRESIDYCEVVNDKDLYVLNSSNWSENSDLK